MLLLQNLNIAFPQMTSIGITSPPFNAEGLWIWTMEDAHGYCYCDAACVHWSNSWGACHMQGLLDLSSLLILLEQCDPSLEPRKTCVLWWSCSTGVMLLESFRKGWVPWDSQSSWRTELPSGKSQDDSCSCQTHPISMEDTDSLLHINRLGCQKCLCNSDVWCLEHTAP
jgi:hypothetical protein